MPSRLESLLLGIAGGALAVGYFGPLKVALAMLGAALGSYAYRRWLAPKL